ncbi:hypothetical protein [Jannaschia sp. R86511]|uniref:hypothetical protein n=1 Tax=Jannaschia sp. R86511 TaxID=3093853 RepID=UPI0036D2D5FF
MASGGIRRGQPAGTWHRAVQLDVERVPSISSRPVGGEVTPLLRLLLDRLGEPGLVKASRAATEAVLDLLRHGLPPGHRPDPGQLRA